MKREERDVESILRRSLPSASAQQADAALARVHGRLQSDSGDVVVPPISDAPVASAARTRWIQMAAAAVLVLAAVVGTSKFLRPSADLFRVVEGDVRQGRTIRSNGGGGAVLELADGSRVEMRSLSELSLEHADDGLRIRLMRGGIIVDAATQSTGHLYVQTRDVTVSVVGTVFLVNADEQGSRVAVIEGEVRVQQGTSERNLLPGEQVATSPAMAAASIQDEIAWARNAPVLAALLQQAAVAAPPAQPQAPIAPRETFEAVSIRPAVVVPGGVGRGAGGGGGRGGRRNLRGDDPCSSGGEPIVDPRRFDAANVTLIQLASWAYGIDCWMNRGPDVLFGGPDWIRRDGYDVVATIPEAAPSYTERQLRLHEAPALQGMLRTMLEDRFSIVVRREMREMPVYVLSVASGGPKFTRVNGPVQVTDRQGNPLDKAAIASGSGPAYRVPAADFVTPEFSLWQEGDTRSFLNRGPSEIHGRKRTMADLTNSLWLYMGRPVLDRTGLKGDFNFFLLFAVPECPTCPFTAPGPDARREPGAGPPPVRPIFSVLEQVGLELKPTREQIEVQVIERVERPSEN